MERNSLNIKLYSSNYNACCGLKTYNSKPSTDIPIVDFHDITDKPATEQYYLGMLERMDSVFMDYSYQTEVRLKMLEEKTLDVNFNALNLVVEALHKVYNIAIDHGTKILDEQIGNTKENMKIFYSMCAKLYLNDYLIWVAIFQNKDDIFYKP